MKRATLYAAALAILVIVVLAMPIPQWRTGEVPQPALLYAPKPRTPDGATRVWIDADAACGTGRHRDPDDCIALLSTVSAPRIEIVGISTTYGNAPVSVTDGVMRELVHQLSPNTDHVLPVFRGCGAAAQRCLDDNGSIGAQAALRQALQAGAMDYLALGPLTNLAAVLAREPALASRVTRVIAVMGRRPGHRFHPSEIGASEPCCSTTGRSFAI